MYVATVLLHIIVCLALIMIVLLQTGKGAEMGAGLRGSSQTLFGGTTGTTFLGKLTTGAAVLFMITCLLLNFLTAGPGSRSIMQDAPAQAPTGPAIPEARPVPNAPLAPPAPPDSSAVPGQPAPAIPGPQSAVETPKAAAAADTAAQNQSAPATVPAKQAEPTPAKKK